MTVQISNIFGILFSILLFGGLTPNWLRNYSDLECHQTRVHFYPVIKGEINNVTEDNRNTEQTYAWYSDESDIRMSDLNCIH